MDLLEKACSDYFPLWFQWGLLVISILLLILAGFLKFVTINKKEVEIENLKMLVKKELLTLYVEYQNKELTSDEKIQCLDEEFEKLSRSIDSNADMSIVDEIREVFLRKLMEALLHFSHFVQVRSIVINSEGKDLKPFLNDVVVNQLQRFEKWIAITDLVVESKGLEKAKIKISDICMFNFNHIIELIPNRNEYKDLRVQLIARIDYLKNPRSINEIVPI